MVWAGPRGVVARPCAGCALPWNASFMTIPFEVGIFAKAPNRFELQLEPAYPRPSGRGFRRLQRYRRLCVVVWWDGVRPAATGRVWVLSRGRATCFEWRISAGYSTGGYPPVDRMPYRDANSRLTRRNIRHNRHAGDGPAGAARGADLRGGGDHPGEPRQDGVRVGDLFGEAVGVRERVDTVRDDNRVGRNRFSVGTPSQRRKPGG
jgi:hypothetical protein